MHRLVRHTARTIRQPQAEMARVLGSQPENRSTAQDIHQAAVEKTPRQGTNICLGIGDSWWWGSEGR